MNQKAWSCENTHNIVFVIDAGHSVEEDIIRDWLAKEKVKSNYSGTHSIAVVSLSHDSEALDVDEIELILRQAEVEDALFIPLRVVWKNRWDNLDFRPRLRDLLGANARRPGRWMAARILKNDPSRVSCIVGKPAPFLDLKLHYEEQAKITLIDESFAQFIAARAGLTLDIEERRLRGGRYKAPRQVARQIRASQEYKEELGKISKDTGKSQTELREEALPIFKELISVPQIFWQDVMASVNRIIMSMGYEDELVVNKKSLLRFRQIVRDHPSALLWTHKTHIDGVAMQAVLFENDFPTPHIVGGINMAFAGVGFLARRSGAIFIRRSFKDDPLYKLILRRYLAYLLEKRFPLTWSFEGTRSRVGKLMPPRYGILKYVMDAVANSSSEKLHIIPIAINYDLINDVKDYVAEQQGGVKRPESLSWFVSYLRRLRQPLGRIYIDFGEPVVVDSREVDEESLELQKIAFRVGVEANRVTPITLTSLLAMSLLGSAPRAQTVKELMSGLDDFLNWARRRDIKLSSDFDKDKNERMLELVELMVKSGLIICYDQGPEAVYAVAENQHAQVSYYRNTIVHHFVTKAIAELSLLHASAQDKNVLQEFWKETARLRDIFKFEFFYVPSDEFNQEVDNELNLYDPNWKESLESNREFAAGFLTQLKPLCAHAVLRPYVEAYRVIADIFAGLDSGQTLDKKDAIQKAFKYSRQAYLQRRISSRASIARVFFENGIRLMDNYGLLMGGDESTKSRRSQISHNLRELAHQLDQIQTLAMPRRID